MIYEGEGDDSRPTKRSRHQNIYVETKFDIKPLGRTGGMKAEQPSRTSTSAPQPIITITRQPSRHEIAAVIAAASAAAATPTPLSAPPSEENMRKKKSSKPERKHQTSEEKEANKEKRLLKLVGQVVVKCMSKYQKQFDTTQFKKHAKEVRGVHYQH